jgi:hypothetical protein
MSEEKAKEIAEELMDSGVATFNLRNSSSDTRKQLFSDLISRLDVKFMSCDWRQTYPEDNRFYFIKDIGMSGYVLPHREAFITRSPKYVVFGGLNASGSLQGGENILFKNIIFSDEELRPFQELISKVYVPFKNHHDYDAMKTNAAIDLRRTGYYGKRIKFGQIRRIGSHALFHNNELQLYYHLGFGYKCFHDAFEWFIQQQQLNIFPIGEQLPSPFTVRWSPSTSFGRLREKRLREALSRCANGETLWRDFLDLYKQKMKVHQLVNLSEDDFIIFDNDVFSHARNAYIGNFKQRKVCAFLIQSNKVIHGTI